LLCQWSGEGTPELREKSILRVYYTQTGIGTLRRTNTSSSVRSVVRIGSGNVEYYQMRTWDRLQLQWVYPDNVRYRTKILLVVKGRDAKAVANHFSRTIRNRANARSIIARPRGFCSTSTSTPLWAASRAAGAFFWPS